MVFVVLTKFLVSAAAFESLRSKLSVSGWALTETDYRSHDRRFEAAAPVGADGGALGRTLRECGIAAEVHYFLK